MKTYCLYCAHEYDDNRSLTLMRVKKCGATYCQVCDEPRAVSEQLFTYFHGDVALRSVDGAARLQFETGCKTCADAWERAGVPVLLRNGKT